MSLPVILRPEAESDIQDACDQLVGVRVGLGKQFLARVREVLTRVEKMPELHGVVQEDVRAARLKQFRYIVYFVAFQDPSMCLPSCTALGTPRRGGPAYKEPGQG